VIGASVLVKGTSIGTLTDINGKFTISSVPASATILVVSFVGMKAQEVAITGNPLQIVMKENNTDLDEIVVIGYGSVKKSDLTGSVSAVSQKELTKNPSMSAAQALQGKTSGVVVVPSSEPGKAATIRVRGVGSINNSSNPIFIVDGIRMDDLEGIHPQDIESLQVIKDASPAAIYAANGSNGVIIVTTKRVKSGKPVINFNSYLTYNREPKKYDMMNADEYSAFYSEVKGDRFEYTPEFREKYYGEGWQKGTDWQDLLFDASISQNYHVAISGGGEKSHYNVSFAYRDDKANVIKKWADSYTIRANSDFQLGKKVKVGENFSARYIMGQSPTTTGSSSVWVLNVSPLMKVHNDYYKGGFESFQALYWMDADGNLHAGSSPDDILYPTYRNTVGNDKPNPLAPISLGDSRNYGLNTLASVYLQIDFTDWLMFKTTPSADISYGRARSWMPVYEGNRGSAAATLTEGYSEKVRLSIENQLSIKKKFNDAHQVQFTLVQEAYQALSQYITATGSGFNFESLPTMTNALEFGTMGGISDYRRDSYLARLIY
ncbi:MAG: SusC/RagA family TonB-linked outer membrane protein, partial [Bacteroides xylanisolvens]